MDDQIQKVDFSITQMPMLTMIQHQYGVGVGVALNSNIDDILVQTNKRWSDRHYQLESTLASAGLR